MFSVRISGTVIALALSALASPHAFAATLVAELAPNSAWTFAGPDATYGWEFFVLSGNTIPIDALGMWDHNSDGLAEPHQIGLWDGTGTLLESLTITNANSTPYPSVTSDGRWLFAPIAARTLPAGGYTIGVYTGTGADDFRTSLNPPTHMLGVVFGVTALFDVGFQRPTFGMSRVPNIFGPNLSFGVVPEPTVTAPVLLAALIRTRFRSSRRHG